MKCYKVCYFVKIGFVYSCQLLCCTKLLKPFYKWQKRKGAYGKEQHPECQKNNKISSSRFKEVLCHINLSDNETDDSNDRDNKAISVINQFNEHDVLF